LADDIILPGDGIPVATDEVGGKHYQRIKIELAGENAAGTLLTVGQKTMANSISVCLASDQSALSSNVSQWGGVGTSLGQKAEASSVPVVLATEQDFVKATSATPGLAAGLATWDGFNEVWWPWPASPVGTPQVQVVATDLIGNQTNFTIDTTEPDYARPGLYTRNIPSRPVQTTDTITAVSDTVQLNVVNYSHLVFSISGTYASVNLIFEASIDSGTTWGTVQARRLDTSTIETTSGSLTNTTRHWKLSVDSFTQFRVRATGYTSGTATIKFSASFQPHDPIVAATDVTLGGGYVTAYIDGAATVQQDTLTSLYNTIPAGGWDNSAGQFAAIPLSNSGATVSTAVVGTVTVDVNSSSVAAVARGKIAAASLTNAYTTLLTMGGSARALHLYNSTDQPVLITLDNGTTDSVELDAGESYVIDYAMNGMSLTSSTIKAKYVSTAPSVGSVRAILARY